MDKAKILKLCNEIEDVACDIARITMDDMIYAESRMIFDKAKEIAAEIVAPPKSNADRIRQMTDEELADKLTDGLEPCNMCSHEYCCGLHSKCVDGVLLWLKQEVKDDEMHGV